MSRRETEQAGRKKLVEVKIGTLLMNWRNDMALRKLLVGVFAVAIVFLFDAAVAAAEPPPASWAYPEWRYRQFFELIRSGSEAEMNTGIVEFAPPPGAVAPGCADIRVTDENGRPVESKPVEDKDSSAAEAADTQVVRLQFHVTDPAVKYYIVYYGNPKAEAQPADWEQVTAGLKLETRENPQSRAPANFEEMTRMLTESRKVFGRGPRRQINDSENPFGPSDRFISVYRGQIQCPVDGLYEFATNSDDSSFLWIDNDVVAQWPGAHDSSEKFDHTGQVYLKAGPHRIDYYHVQIGGGTLAQAAWRTPDSKVMVLIPPSAFITEMRTRPLWIEDRENPCAAYFTTTTIDSFRLGASGPDFIKLKFKNLSRSAVAPIELTEWNFGDGTLSLDKEPEHMFASGRKYPISLKAVDSFGYESEYTYQLSLRTASPRRIEIVMEISAAASILQPDEALEVEVKCRSAEDLPFQFVAKAFENDKATWSTDEAVVLQKNSWLPVKQTLPLPENPSREQKAVFSLNFDGTEVASCGLRVMRANALGGLSFSQGRIVDASGGLVVLRLASGKINRNLSGLRALLKSKKARIAVIDDVLAMRGKDGYPQLLADKLGSGSGTELNRLELDTGEGSDALLRGLFAKAPDIANTDLVIVSCASKPALLFMQVERFERELQAYIDRLAAETKAPIILVAPPPVLTNPGMSQTYAIAVKRVGMKMGLPVADAYTAFVKGNENDPFAWKELYRDPRSKSPVYTVTPGPKGQALIADSIMNLITNEQRGGK